MKAQEQMPAGWTITGWGPEGEGAEATGPRNERITAPTPEDLPAAIRKHLKASGR